MRSKEDKGSLRYGQRQEVIGVGGGSSCINFEFQKGKEASRSSNHHRAVVSGKPTPSKWDDAQKWLVNLSRVGEKDQSTTTPRDSNADDLRLIAPVPKKEEDYSSGEENGVSTRHSRKIKLDVEKSIWRINDNSDVHLRDMGTEMTPVESQEPSRTNTPIRATRLAGTSPMTSGSSTPDRGQNGVVQQAIESGQIGVTSVENRGETCRGNGDNTRFCQDAEEAIDTKIAAKKEADQDKKLNPLETRATAWDDAERAKYSARYKREEVKIQAWENHEKSKAEMELRRMEVKAERIKSRAQEKYKNKVAATRRIAEEKKANAEAKLNEKTVETSEKADYIRRTGHLPSSFCFKLPSFCW